MEEKIYDLITKMYSEMNQKFDKIDMSFSDIKSDISGMKSDITKLAIGQEKIQNDIEIIFEVVNSHIAENERHHFEIVEMLGNRIDITESAIKRITSVK